MTIGVALGRSPAHCDHRFPGLEHPDHRAQQELRDLASRGSRVQLVGDVGQLAHETGQELLFGVRLGGLPPRRGELLLRRGQARLDRAPQRPARAATEIV